MISELIVFATGEEARDYKNRLKGHCHIDCAWPEMLVNTDFLLGKRWQRVTVSNGADVSLESPAGGPLRNLLQQRTLSFGEDAIYIEL